MPMIGHEVDCKKIPLSSRRSTKVFFVWEIVTVVHIFIPKTGNI